MYSEGVSNVGGGGSDILFDIEKFPTRYVNQLPKFDGYDPDDYDRVPLWICENRNGLEASVTDEDDDNKSGWLCLSKDGWDNGIDRTQVLKSIINEINSIWSGEVYGYTITDENVDETDSCWGFIGDMKYCITEAKRQVDAEMDTRAKHAPSPNENCLRNLSCPKCGASGDFRIETTATTTWADDGCDFSDAEDTTWQNNSSCACIECSHSATIWDFTVKPVCPKPEDDA